MFIRPTGNAGNVLLAEEHRTAERGGTDEDFGRFLGHHDRGKDSGRGFAQRDDPVVFHQDDEIGRAHV